MIRLGKQVTQAGDPLQDVSLQKLYEALANPKGEVAAAVRQLQAIKALDPGQYRKLKTMLPYVVCAQFHPKIRRKENFLKTERFIIDIDHLQAHNLDLQELKIKLSSDSRLELMYISPGGDGLKLFFKLCHPIDEISLYTLFYKSFALSFAKQYGLGPAIDHKTHDVSRCCFVSFDPETYFNPGAECINPNAFVSQDSLFEMDQIKESIKSQEKALEEEFPDAPSRQKPELPDDIILNIKEKLGMRVPKGEQKEYIQPEELEYIMEKVRILVSEIGAEISLSKPISYGRQVQIKAGKRWAEVNIFSGKRGVKVVGTTKTGSDKNLCTELVRYLQTELDEYA